MVSIVSMFNVVFVLFSCKDKGSGNTPWDVCSVETRTWDGPNGSEFGFRIQKDKESNVIWLTAPEDCETPLYTLENNTLASVDWAPEECMPRIGQEIALESTTPWLYAPLSKTWIDTQSNDIIDARRLAYTSTTRKILLDERTVQAGGTTHTLPALGMDLAVYADRVAVLTRGSSETSGYVWVDGDSTALPNDDTLYNRIHHFAPAPLGKPQWLLGGGGETLRYLSNDGLTTVALPEWSLLHTDIPNHHRISMGYDSTLGSLDGDVHLDWVVSAPTAGSGQNGFPEQAGWVGWFEQHNRVWVLQREWIGDSAFEHLGWSVLIDETTTQHRLLAGSPTISKLSQLTCFESALFASEG